MATLPIETATGAQTTPGIVSLPPRRKRYGSDQVGVGTIAARMIIGITIASAFMFPYVVMAVGSLKSRPEILQVPPVYFPETPRFDNFATMWSTAVTPLTQNMISTIVIASCATLLVLLAATPAAYYTARFKFPGKMMFMFLVIVTQMLQPAVLTAGLFRQMLALNIADTWLAMKIGRAHV